MIPLVTEKASEGAPCTGHGHTAIMEFEDNCDELGWAADCFHEFPESIPTDFIKLKAFFRSRGFWSIHRFQCLIEPFCVMSVGIALNWIL